jgi:hypothetical protein
MRAHSGVFLMQWWYRWSNEHLVSPEVVRLAAGGAVQELPAKDLHLGGKAIAALLTLRLEQRTQRRNCLGLVRTFSRQHLTR